MLQQKIDGLAFALLAMQTKTHKTSVPQFCGTEIFIYLEKNIMENWTANYVIYENHVNKHIGIHKNGCSQIEKNGGNGIGKYIGFSNFEDAYEYAKNSSLPIKDCSFCIKNYAK